MSRRIWSRSIYSLALPILFMAAVATGSTAARAEICWKKDSPVPTGMTLTG
jgi:hypothetical protein